MFVLLRRVLIIGVVLFTYLIDRLIDPASQENRIVNITIQNMTKRRGRKKCEEGKKLYSLEIFTSSVPRIKLNIKYREMARKKIMDQFSSFRSGKAKCQSVKFPLALCEHIRSMCG